MVVRIRWSRSRTLTLSPIDVAVLQIGALLATLFRGLDYLVNIDQETSGLSIIERAMPLWGWGTTYTAVGAIGLIALSCRRFEILAIAHALAFGAFAAFAVGFFVDIVHRDTGGFYGWRTSTDWALVLCPLHIVLAQACLDAWRDRRSAN